MRIVTFFERSSCGIKHAFSHSLLQRANVCLSHVGGLKLRDVTRAQRYWGVHEERLSYMVRLVGEFSAK